MSLRELSRGLAIKNVVISVAIIAVLGAVSWKFNRDNNPPLPPEPEPALKEVNRKKALALRESQASIAARMLRALHEQAPEDNIACSPSGLHAVATALAMGSEGALKTKLESLVGPSAPANIRSYRPREKDLAGRGILFGGTGIWAANSGILTPDYTRHFEEVFDFKPRVTSIGSGKISDVDAWLAKQTKGKVTTLGPMGPRPWTAILLDARYFHDRWSVRFDPAKTTDRPFTLASGEVVPTPTMEGTGLSFEFAENDEMAKLEFPFRNHLTFIALVPKKGIESLLKSPDLEQGLLSLEAGGAVVSRGSVGRIAMPKWKVDKSIELEKLLDSLGLTHIFGAQSERCSATPHLGQPMENNALGIDVDEDGAEAFAYTSTRMVTKSALPKAQNFVIDQPFVFAIVDRSGPIFFAGIINDPRPSR